MLLAGHVGDWRLSGPGNNLQITQLPSGFAKSSSFTCSHFNIVVTLETSLALGRHVNGSCVLVTRLIVTPLPLRESYIQLSRALKCLLRWYMKPVILGYRS